MPDYYEVIAQVPLPSERQTERFADYVVLAHSWHRHLPLFPPGARFVFFLDLNAGRHLQHKAGKYNARDVRDSQDCSHYSQKPTAAYRKEYGYWNYWICDNPRRPDRERVIGPWIDPNTNELQPLPPEIVSRCSCYLTAFLRPGSPDTFDLSNPFLKSELQRFAADCGWLGSWFQRDPERRHYQQLAKWIRKKSDRWYLVASENAVVEREKEAQRERLIQTLLHARAFYQKQCQPA